MILYGDKLGDKINKETKAKIKALDKTPGLAAILVGNNSASRLYVSIKKEIAKKIGIKFYEYYLSEKIKEDEILKIIDLLNQDKNINGIIVQLPLPKKFNTDKIIQSINTKKDVDGFHKKNILRLLQNKKTVVSPLVSGTVELIKSSGQKLENKSTVIIANSKIFSDSLKSALKKDKISKKNIKWVKEINKKSAETISEADIVIIAIGKAKILKKEHIKKGAIVIDIGINKRKDKTVGDVDFNDVKDKAGFITPVPRGVGPMTVAMLMKNTVELFKK